MNRTRALLVVPAALSMIAASACTPGSDSPEGAGASSNVMNVSNLRLDLKSVPVGDSVEVAEMTKTPGKANVTIEEVGERAGRPWVGVRTTFSNGDVFRFRLYHYLPGSATSTSVGDRLSVALAEVTDNAGRKTATIGIKASGAQDLNLAPTATCAKQN